MIKLFRLIALSEGTSYVLLLFIAVPIKYYLNDPTYVKILGMPHGILFIVYLIFAVIFKLKKKCNPFDFFIISAASLIPFGTFYVDKKYLRETNKI